MRRWQILQSWLCGLLLVCFYWVASSLPSEAMDLAHQKPIMIQGELGNIEDALAFFPGTFTFQSGKRYKLHLENPSPEKHYFTAKDFADAVWSQKVDAGNVEIKGAIHELELRSHTEADWVFVAMRPGTYELRCTITGHAEAGMVGKLVIEP